MRHVHACAVLTLCARMLAAVRAPLESIIPREAEAAAAHQGGRHVPRALLENTIKTTGPIAYRAPAGKHLQRNRTRRATATPHTAAVVSASPAAIGTFILSKLRTRRVDGRLHVLSYDCGQGQYRGDSSHSYSSCRLCASGQYQAFTGHSACRNCASGQTSSSGASSCSQVYCNSGQYLSGSSWCDFLPAPFVIR